MDALFQTKTMSFLPTTQKEKLFKDTERQWNKHCLREKERPGRKVDFEIYKSIFV